MAKMHKTAVSLVLEYQEWHFKKKKKKKECQEWQYPAPRFSNGNIDHSSQIDQRTVINSESTCIRQWPRCPQRPNPFISFSFIFCFLFKITNPSNPVRNS